MRYVKMLGLAVTAALASMAFIGASSASATFATALCSEASMELKCPEAKLVKHLHMEAGTTELKGLFGVTVLCLKSLALAETDPGKPSLANAGEYLKFLITELKFELCGTNAAHSNCTAVTLHGELLKLPLLDLLKTEKDLATGLVLTGTVLVNCPTVGLHCVFGGDNMSIPFTAESALHKEGSGTGLIKLEEASVPKKEALIACPSGEAKWTALYSPLPSHIWIRS